MQYITKSEKDTKKIGEDWGKKCVGGEVFLLSGDLGAGKTQFVKGLATGLKIKDDITSPTFTYEKIYSGREGLSLYHFDLYRELVLDEDIKLLMEEAFSDPKGITAIEWSERMGEFSPHLRHAEIDSGSAKTFNINLKWISENNREIEIG